jgi:NAD+-dependent protein deacetylase SIR2
MSSCTATSIVYDVPCALLIFPAKKSISNSSPTGWRPTVPNARYVVSLSLSFAQYEPRGDIPSAEARLARSARPLKIGTLRPAIVLYDEAHPLGDDIGAIQAFDVSRKPDLLIIMGTSLKVHGLRKLVKEFAKAVHASAPPNPLSGKAQAKRWVGKVVFVNKTPPGSEWNGIIDYHVEGETDAWTHKVEEEWRKMRPSDWEVQQTLDDTDGGAFKAMKEAVGKGIRKYLSLSTHSS